MLILDKDVSFTDRLRMAQNIPALTIISFKPKSYVKRLSARAFSFLFLLNNYTINYINDIIIQTLTMHDMSDVLVIRTVDIW